MLTANPDCRAVMSAGQLGSSRIMLEKVNEIGEIVSVKLLFIQEFNNWRGDPNHDRVVRLEDLLQRSSLEYELEDKKKIELNTII
jgi:hypothetical protein